MADVTDQTGRQADRQPHRVQTGQAGRVRCSRLGRWALASAASILCRWSVDGSAEGLSFFAGWCAPDRLGKNRRRLQFGWSRQASIEGPNSHGSGRLRLSFPAVPVVHTPAAAAPAQGQGHQVQFTSLVQRTERSTVQPCRPVHALLSLRPSPLLSPLAFLAGH